MQVVKEKGILNTLVEISVNSNKDKKFIEQDIENALSKFDYVASKFSRFDPRSELSRLNKSLGNWFKCSSELFSLIVKALEISKETDYIFDPTIIDILKAYGYDKSFDPSRIKAKLDLESTKQEISQIKRTRPHIKDIQIDNKNLKIKLQKSQQIDLGSLAKGYAIDLAKEYLIREGYDNFFVNAGGDIWANSQKQVALFDPRTKGILKNIKIKNQSIAGSGSLARKVKEFNHIIYPMEASPNEEILQSYVLADNALEADGFATVLFLLGKKGLALIRKKGMKGIIITDKKVIGDVDQLN